MQITFQSATTEEEYTITVEAGVEHCTCKDFKYRRQAKGERCKHLRDFFGEQKSAA